MQCWLLLDIVVRKGAAILQLLAGKDQPLLIWWDALLVLDLGLHILDGVWRLHFQGDGLACQCLDKDLHATSETKDKMEGWLLLDVVVWKGAAIFKLLAGKDQPLLVWGNSLLVLDFGLDVFDGVWWLNLQGDCLACQSLDKDLHATS